MSAWFRAIGSAPFCIAILLIAITQLSGCAGMGAVKLPSGDQVVVTRVGKMYFSKGPPALTISFNTAYDPVADFHGLQRESDELFAFEENVIGASHLEDVILQANHKTGGGPFVSTSRGYNFVYHKTSSGWCKYQSDKSCQPFPERSYQVDAAAPSIAAKDSTLATLLTQRYAALEAAHDNKAYAEVLAPDFVLTNVLGHTMAAPEAIQMWESRPKDPSKVIDHKLLALKRKAHTVIVQRRIDAKTVEPAADGGRLNVEFIWLTSDTWINDRGTWLLQTSDADKMDYYLNGRLIDHLSRVRTPS